MPPPIEPGTLDALEDAQLARRIIAAAPSIDEPAEAELCRRLAPRMRLYGLKHLRSAAAAADLVQDVLIMTLQRLRAGNIREPDHLVSFVLGTCRQVIIDQRRAQGRRERILATFAGDVPISEQPTSPPLDLERLQHCLTLLSERERTVVLMSFYDERQAADVGQEVGVSPANVRVIRHRSIERLRRCMEGVDSASGRQE